MLLGGVRDRGGVHDGGGGDSDCGRSADADALAHIGVSPRDCGHERCGGGGGGGSSGCRNCGGRRDRGGGGGVAATAALRLWYLLAVCHPVTHLLHSKHLKVFQCGSQLYHRAKSVLGTPLLTISAVARSSPRPRSYRLSQPQPPIPRALFPATAGN